LLKVYLDHQLAYYEWLKQHGVKFLDVTNAAGMTVPRAHDVHPAQVVKILHDYAASKGVKVMLETPVKRLVFDDKTKRIVGVLADRGGVSYAIRAKKGVLLSCGGYSRNKKMLSQYTPSMVNAKVINGLGSYGDGILMAQEYGADFLDTPYVKATFGFTLHPVSIAKDFALCYYAGAIVTNKEGKRIIDESKSYKLVGDAALAQTGAIGYQVYDEAIRQRAHKSTTSLLEVEKQKDAIYSGNTIEEVARKAGVDPTALAETVRRYNGYVATGKDLEFGRKHLSGGYGKPVKIEKPPFYIFPSTAVIIGTSAGVRVTTKLEVVDVFGEKIPGLYATGEMIGGFHGAAYMTGTSFGKTQVLGRVAIGSIAEA
jgi:fumarate reductase flavoprotein subunit